MAKVINELGSFKSILEIGVGEATTLNLVLKNLIHSPQEILGFDISWSRIKFAKDFSNSDLNLNSNINFFTANLFQIPLLDNCIDIVYTSHSLEPNGGREKEALIELYRVTKKYLILLEPSFELGNFNSKERMKKHGYVTELFKTASELNFKIIEYKLFEHSSNPLNPTGLLIIEKGTESNSSGCDLVCPITLTSLSKHNNHLLYSKDSCLSYPIIEGIPCLLKENAILTSHLKTKI